ncbi:ubiquitin-like protein [Phellopilus nigrolimitatus]|nr:ubiquitin-like protein [Phellopilus nigrolimitatus]
MSDEEHVPPPTQEENEEVSPKAEDANAPINIKVVSSGGEEVFFKIKRSTKLSKLQSAYAHKIGKEVGTIRFLYDGDRINDDDTPASLDMEENDTIDVMVERQSFHPFVRSLCLHILV